MIELNKEYSTKELSAELGISYDTLRKHREMYEKHLQLFYDYNITLRGNGVYYIFIRQYNEFIPYKEYRKSKKSKLIQSKIEDTIALNNRQTASNIARIIKVEDEIIVLDLQLSTLTVYVRDELRELINRGEYIKSDFRWCYLEPKQNKYILMSDEEVKELRNFFSESEDILKEEKVFSEYSSGDKGYQESSQALGELKINSFIKGIEKYQSLYNKRPVKVPLYIKALDFAENTN